MRRKKGPKNTEIDSICEEKECKGKGFYILPAVCYNCDWEGTVKQTKGHSSFRFECPNCGCEEVRTK